MWFFRGSKRLKWILHLGHALGKVVPFLDWFDEQFAPKMNSDQLWNKTHHFSGFFSELFLIIIGYTHMCTRMSHLFWWMWGSQRTMFGTLKLHGIADGCKSLNMDAGDQTQVFYKSWKCSYPISHLSRPQILHFLTLNNHY